MKYTFGTSNAAAARLAEMAKFFNPIATHLLKKYVEESAGTVVDVGCGPGFTTNMLYHATKSQDIFGLDNSPDFLAFARTHFPYYNFIEHNVMQVPFPITADLLNVRFVLSHLPDPVERIRDWVTQLNASGTLIIEEVEAVETEVELFQVYLSINEALVRTPDSPEIHSKQIF